MPSYERRLTWLFHSGQRETDNGEPCTSTPLQPQSDCFRSCNNPYYGYSHQTAGSKQRLAGTLSFHCTAGSTADTRGFETRPPSYPIYAKQSLGSLQEQTPRPPTSRDFPGRTTLTARIKLKSSSKTSSGTKTHNTTACARVLSPQD